MWPYFSLKNISCVNKNHEENNQKNILQFLQFLLHKVAPTSSKQSKLIVIFFVDTIHPCRHFEQLYWPNNISFREEIFI